MEYYDSVQREELHNLYSSLNINSNDKTGRIGSMQKEDDTSLQNIAWKI
jgi:hypothetical protein